MAFDGFDEETEPLALPPPLQTPNEAAASAAQQRQSESNLYQTLQLTKAQDMKSAGVPFYSTPNTDGYTDKTGRATGDVQPFTDATGTPISQFDEKNNVGWDGLGSPVQVSQKPTGEPVVESAYANTPVTTDQKTGDQYQIRNGLPWQWVGQDDDIIQKNLDAEKQSAINNAVTVLGRKLTTDEHQLIHDQVDIKTQTKAFNSQFGLDGTEESGTAAKKVSDSFNNNVDGYASPQANETDGFFGSGQLTPDAQALRQGLDASKAAALQQLGNLTQAQQSIVDRQQALKTQQDQRSALQQMQVDAANAKLEKLGISTSGGQPVAPTRPDEDVPQNDNVPRGTNGEQTGAPENPEVPPGQLAAIQKSLNDAASGNKTYGYDPKAGISFKTGQTAQGLQDAVADGLIDPEKAKQALPIAQKADAQYKYLIAAAGENPKLKAFLTAGFKSAVSMEGGTLASAAVTLASSEFDPWLAGIGGTLTAESGGWGAWALPALVHGITFLVGQYGSSKALDAIQEKLSEYNDTVKSLGASAELEPHAAALGSLLGAGPRALQSVANLTKLGSIAAEDAARTAMAAGANATDAAAAARLAASKLVGGRLASGAAFGAVFEGVVRPSIDGALNLGADALGIKHDAFQAPTTGSILQNAVLGALMTGQGMKFRELGTNEVGDIFRKAAQASQAGVPIETVLSASDIDVLNKVGPQFAEMMQKGGGSIIKDPNAFKITVRQALLAPDRPLGNEELQKAYARQEASWTPEQRLIVESVRQGRTFDQVAQDTGANVSDVQKAYAKATTLPGVTGAISSNIEGAEPANGKKSAPATIGGGPAATAESKPTPTVDEQLSKAQTEPSPVETQESLNTEKAAIEKQGATTPELKARFNQINEKLGNLPAAPEPTPTKEATATPPAEKETAPAASAPKEEGQGKSASPTVAPKAKIGDAVTVEGKSGTVVGIQSHTSGESLSFVKFEDGTTKQVASDALKPPAELPKEDPLLGKALDVLKEHGSVTASALQRKLRMGYSRAAEAILTLRARGDLVPIEGHVEGSPKPKGEISNALGGMAEGATGNMYQMLFEKLKAGDTTELGKPSRALIQAKPFFDRGDIKSPDQLREFFNKPPEVSKPPSAKSPSEPKSSLADIPLEQLHARATANPESVPAGPKRSEMLTDRKRAAMEIVRRMEPGDKVTLTDGKERTVQNVDRNKSGRPLWVKFAGDAHAYDANDIPTQLIPSEGKPAGNLVKSEKSTGPTADQKFQDKVNEIARGAPQSEKLGDEKVFISKVFDKYKEETGSKLSLQDFKSELLRNRTSGGAPILSRADFHAGFNDEQLKEHARSEMNVQAGDGRLQFHFIKPAGNPEEMAKERGIEYQGVTYTPAGRLYAFKDPKTNGNFSILDRNLSADALTFSINKGREAFGKEAVGVGQRSPEEANDFVEKMLAQAAAEKAAEKAKANESTRTPTAVGGEPAKAVQPRANEAAETERAKSGLGDSTSPGLPKSPENSATTGFSRRDAAKFRPGSAELIEKIHRESGAPVRIAQKGDAAAYILHGIVYYNPEAFEKEGDNVATLGGDRAAYQEAAIREEDGHFRGIKADSLMGYEPGTSQLRIWQEATAAVRESMTKVYGGKQNFRSALHPGTELEARLYEFLNGRKFTEQHVPIWAKDAAKLESDLGDWKLPQWLIRHMDRMKRLVAVEEQSPKEEKPSFEEKVFSALKETPEDFGDKRWIKTVYNTYLSQTGEKITLDEFKSNLMKNLGSNKFELSRFDLTGAFKGDPKNEAFEKESEVSDSLGSFHFIRKKDAPYVRRRSVDQSANEAATSPQSESPPPTAAQKEAGNYQKGHFKIGPLDISIEHPAGTSRKEGWNTLSAHYGYIKGTLSGDGEQIDTFIKPGTTADFAGPVFVVNQPLAQKGKVDHKAVIGAGSKEEAAHIYNSNYPAKFQVPLEEVKEFPSVAEFNDWATGASRRTAPAKGTKKPSKYTKYAQEFEKEKIFKDLFGARPVIDQTVYHSTAHEGEFSTEPEERTGASPGTVGIFTTPDMESARGWGGPGAKVRQMRVQLQRPFDVRNVPLERVLTKQQLAQELSSRGLPVTAADIPGDVQARTFDDWKPEIEELTPKMRAAGFDGYVTDTTANGRRFTEYVPFSKDSLSDEKAMGARALPDRFDDTLPPEADEAALKVCRRILPGAGLAQDLAGILSELGPKAPRYAQSFWQILKSMGAKGPLEPNWKALFQGAFSENTSIEAPKESKKKGEFERQLSSAIKRVPASKWFGDDKVFISDAYEAWKQETGSHNSLDEFKASLINSLRAGLTELSRADMGNVMDDQKKELQASKILYGDEQFEFINVKNSDFSKPASDDSVGNDQPEQPVDRGKGSIESGNAESAPEQPVASGSGDRGRVGGEQPSGDTKNGEERDAPGGSTESPSTGGERAVSSDDRERRKSVTSERGGNLQPVRRPEPPIARVGNYVIQPGDIPEKFSASKQFEANIVAIETMKEIESTGRPVTHADQEKLAKYVGWGGMKNAFNPDNEDWKKRGDRLSAALTPSEYDQARSTINDAHYTSPAVVKAIYSALGHFGFAGGKMIEGGVGVGNFIGMMPAEMRGPSSYLGIEKDGITARIAQLLYPDATIMHSNFEALKIAPNSMDASAGNPPFGNTRVFNESYPALSKFSIHNFFIGKQLEALRPGGIGAWVVSHYFLDANDVSARDHINAIANFLGAVRLPNTAFKGNANTEVTTDLVFFQKKQPGETRDLNHPWIGVRTHSVVGGAPMPMNDYFGKNQHMMLGVPSMEGTLRAGQEEFTLNPIPGKDLGEQLAEAIKHLPQGIYRKAIDAIQAEQAAKPADFPPSTKPGNLFVKEGKIFRRGPDANGTPTTQEVEAKSKRATERVAGMATIRTTLNALVRAELEDQPKRELTALRKKLNQQYDDFVKANGLLNELANRRAIAEDVDADRVGALERNFDPGISKEVAKKREVEARPPSADKADIFTKRVNAGISEPTSAGSAEDALALSLNHRGTVDPAYMAKLTKTKQADVLKKLNGSLIFLDPKYQAWQQKEQYLSGNVRQKLADAKAAVASGQKQFEPNVEALQKVIPKDIEPQDIRIPIGAGWAKPDYVRDFARELSGRNPSHVAYVPATGAWNFKANWPATIETTQTYGTEKFPLDDILDALLNSKSIRLYKPGPDDTRIFDAESTAAAQQKADEVRSKWEDWVMHDETRRADLHRTYNDTVNNFVDPHYSGQHLTLPGKNVNITLLPHQLSGVWRMMTDRTVMLDKAVGAGKTFEIAAAVMEMRRTGSARKQVVCVPNHLTMQWRDAFVQLYPNANILTAAPDDFTKANRSKLFGKIMTGDYDAIILGHSTLKKIGLNPADETAILQEMHTEISDAIQESRIAERKSAGKGRDSRFISQMEKTKQNLEAKIAKMNAAAGARDKVATFDELGIDGLYLDEAHEFKNLFYMTQMQRVAGLGDPNGSAKAFDLYAKVRFLKQRFNNQAPVVFATGTPISNSLVEMFTMQRYLQQDQLRAMGMNTLDAWAKVFGDVREVYEVDPSGTGYRTSTRFAQFANVGELASLYRTMADVVTLDDLKQQAIDRGEVFPVPKMKTGKPMNTVVKRSSAQALYFGIEEPVLNDQGKPVMTGIGEPLTDDEGSPIIGPDGKPKLDTVGYPDTSYTKGSILDRIKNMPKDPAIDNMLKVTSDARKSSLDMRLVHPEAADFQESKPNIAVRNIVAAFNRWNAQKGTQIVFCDLSVPASARGRSTTKARLAALAPPTDENPSPDETSDEGGAETAVSMDDLLADQSSFSVYDDMRAKLVAKGIPAAQIAFIHDYDTPEKKQKLFTAMNNGDVRVLFGSTAKMGAGTNVQRRLVAMHHMDCPWRPSDLEQREGRIIRRGNMFYEADPEGFEAEIHRYATEQSYDTRMWQIIEHKASGILGFRKADRSTRTMDDVGGEAANAADMKAAASGDPRIQREIELRNEVAKLELLAKAFKSNKYAIENESRALRTMVIPARERDIEQWKQVEALGMENPIPEEFLATTAGGAKLTEKAAVVEPFAEAAKTSVSGSKVQFMTYRGIPWFVNATRGVSAVVSLKDDTQATVFHEGDKVTGAGLIQRLDNFLDSKPVDEIAADQRYIDQSRTKVEQLQQLAQKPFPQQEQLDEKRRKHAKLLAQLRSGIEGCTGSGRREPRLPDPKPMGARPVPAAPGNPEERAEAAAAAAGRGSSSRGDVRAARAAVAEPSLPIFRRAVDAARAGVSRTVDAFTKLAPVDTYKAAKGEWLGAGADSETGAKGLQRSAHDAKMMSAAIKEAVPSPLSRMAISRWIEADGDMPTLASQAASSANKFQPIYERAMHLSPEELRIAATARDFFDEIGQRAQSLGLLSDMLEGYVAHFVDASNIPEAQKGASIAAVVGDISVGRMKTRFDRAIRRTFANMFALEQKGYRLQSSDIAEVMAAYSQEMNNVVAARTFVKRLSDLDARDGRPLAVTSGYAKPVGGTPPAALLIKPRGKSDDHRDYASIDHPALRKHFWAGTDENGNPIYVEGDMLIHPDIHRDLVNTLGTSALNKVPAFKLVSDLQHEIKNLMLGFSLFHYVQEGVHAIGHGVNPFQLHQVDYNDPVTRELVNAGLMLTNWDAKQNFSEGLTSKGGIMSKIPVLGPINDQLSGFLFEDYIPGLKIAMAKHAFQRNLRRFAKEIAAGKVTRAQVAQKTAQQANDAFGEQNNRYRGENQTKLHAERIFFLAPDFLKSRMRFVADALTKYGGEQRRALIFLAVAMAVLAKLIERTLTGKNDWHKPFSVTANGREYELRSVPGDILEMLTDPRRFASGRLSPLVSRTTLEAITGRDYRGLKRSGSEQLMDAIKAAVPISLRGALDAAGKQIDPHLPKNARGLLSTSSSDISGAEQVASSLGLRVKRESDITQAKILGHQWRQAQGLESADEAYPPSKFVGLKDALEDGNMARARNEYQLLYGQMTPQQIDKSFRQSIERPFSGGEKTERAFFSSLDSYDREVYKRGVQKRAQVMALFNQISHSVSHPKPQFQGF